MRISAATKNFLDAIRAGMDYDSGMTRLDSERHTLRAFADEVGAYSARSLVFLRAIEHTLSWLDNVIHVLQAHAAYAERINNELCEAEGLLDPDGALVAGLEDGQHKVEALYQVLITKRQSARDDTRLNEGDGIEEGYTEAIAAAADLHNAINTLRWNVGEHDIDCTPHEIRQENLISDPDTLRASLRVLRG